MEKKQQNPDDPYARDSFSLRRMTRRQVWALTIVSIVILIGFLAYAGILDGAVKSIS